MTLAFTIPWNDWQFWAVTALAVAAAWYVLRRVIPAPFGTRRRAGQAASHRATLTIGGKPMERK